MKQSTHRFVARHEAAVMYMMHGELGEAKRILQLISRPVAQDPTIWDEKSSAEVDFFEAFATYFGVDLGFAAWPVRGPARTVGVRIRIYDHGIVPHVLAAAGREDLVASAVGLGDAELGQIADRASEIFARGREKDPNRAVRLAAIEFLTKSG